MRTLLKGGTVITGRGPKRADVLIEGEKVKQVGRLILTPAASGRSGSGAAEPWRAERCWTPLPQEPSLPGENAVCNPFFCKV